MYIQYIYPPKYPHRYQYHFQIEDNESILTRLKTVFMEGEPSKQKCHKKGKKSERGGSARKINKGFFMSSSFWSSLFLGPLHFLGHLHFLGRFPTLSISPYRDTQKTLKEFYQKSTGAIKCSLDTPGVVTASR